MSPRVKVERANGETERVRGTKIVTVTRAEGSQGVELLICNNGVRGDVVTRRLDADGEAAEVLDALLELPAETRRALYNLITGEFCESFNAAPRPKPRYSPPLTPSARRSR